MHGAGGGGAPHQGVVCTANRFKLWTLTTPTNHWNWVHVTAAVSVVAFNCQVRVVVVLSANSPAAERPAEGRGRGGRWEVGGGRPVSRERNNDHQTADSTLGERAKPLPRKLLPEPPEGLHPSAK